MSDYTTIQLSKKTKKQLDKLKISSNESYNEIVDQLIEDTQELTDIAKKEIETAIKEYNSGEIISHEEIKKKLGL